MTKINLVLCGLALALLIACSSTKVGLKENWIDERDVIALVDVKVSDWMVTAGRPTLVEINGDTTIYYYNYRPTMYAVAVYDSTTFFKTWGTAKEAKPTLANATEVWGNRKDVMQIKVLRDSVVSAIISEGPDQKIIMRGLNGELIIDPNSGFNSNISAEQKINEDSKDFNKALKSASGENTWASKYSTMPATTAPVANTTNVAKDSASVAPANSTPATPVDTTATTAVPAPVQADSATTAPSAAVLDSTATAPTDSATVAP